jgi:hypothetical protein
MAANPAELSKEEQDLFEAMRDDPAPPKDKETPKDDAAALAAEKEVAAKAAKEAADKTAAEAAAKGKAEQQKLVPHEALHEARLENKALRKELQDMKQVVAQGDEKLKKFMEGVTKETTKGPKFEDDPAGNLKHENEELRKTIGEVQAKIEKQEGAEQQQARLNQHANYVSAREREFAKENPDYFQASEFVAALWRDEFTEAGFNEADVPKLVFGKALAITTQATQAERDPAAAIYKIAKRYGFAAKQQEKAEEKKPDGESKLKEITKGLEAAKGTSGGTGPDDLSLASLAQMDDAAIDKLVKDPDWWAKNVRRSPLH